MSSTDSKSRVTELVVRVQEGDTSAFEALYQETHRLARKVALAMVNPQLVDDIVQESYIVVYQKVRQLDDPRAFPAWLSRLVIHICYKAQRKKREDEPLPEEGPQTADTTAKALATLALRQALDRLQKDDREILILRELLQLSYEEVAYALVLPVGTVKSRLNTARKRLKDRLEMA